jgi:hypothetical protein
MFESLAFVTMTCRVYTWHHHHHHHHHRRRLHHRRCRSHTTKSNVTSTGLMVYNIYTFESQYYNAADWRRGGCGDVVWRNAFGEPLIYNSGCLFFPSDSLLGCGWVTVDFTASNGESKKGQVRTIVELRKYVNLGRYTIDPFMRFARTRPTGIFSSRTSVSSSR